MKPMIHVAPLKPMLEHHKPMTVVFKHRLEVQTWVCNSKTYVCRLTLKCLSIGTPKIINFLFVSVGKLMVFRCPNIQAHYKHSVLCLNFGTPENNEFSIWDKWKIYYFWVSQYFSTLGYCAFSLPYTSVVYIFVSFPKRRQRFKESILSLKC